MAWLPLESTKLVRNHQLAKRLNPKEKKNIPATASCGDGTQALRRLLPERNDCSELTVTCHPADYSASAVARAVEDCDAHLLNLNLTSDTTPAGEAVVELRVGLLDPSGVARSLERYGYTVASMRSSAESSDEATARRRAEELMHYLSV